MDLNEIILGDLVFIRSVTKNLGMGNLGILHTQGVQQISLLFQYLFSSALENKMFRI